MKRFFIFSIAVAAIAILVSCKKEQALSSNKNVVTVHATYEQPIDADTKLQLSEGASNFALNFDGTETVNVANSTNNTYMSGANAFTITDHSGSTADFTGTLPSVTGETTNYIGVISSFTSSASSTVRGAIAVTQDYAAGGNIANNGFIVARADNCTVGELSSFSFKTMNAFLKIPLVKGTAAAGSSNDYSGGMYVQNVVVEAVNEEAIAGRFGINKTEATWTDGYAEEVSGNISSSVTLDCSAESSGKGLALSASATDLYIAVAFKTYAKGLKVTINVMNAAGKAGKQVVYISKDAPLTIARNTMVRMPALTVNPDDDAVVTYTLVEDPSKVVAGTYYLAAYDGSNYQLATGSLVSNKDLATAAYTYNPVTKVLTGSGAADVTLVAVTGGFNVKFGDDFLYANSTSNRTLRLGATAAVWTFGVSVNGKGEERGGMTMKETTNNTCIVSASASSAYLRNYGVATNGNYGVYLFKKD